MSDLWPEKITSSFGKRPIKVVEQVSCTTDDIKTWKLEARLQELTLYLGQNHKVMSAEAWQRTNERIADLKAQLAALRGEQ